MGFQTVHAKSSGNRQNLNAGAHLLTMMLLIDWYPAFSSEARTWDMTTTSWPECSRIPAWTLLQSLRGALRLEGKKPGIWVAATANTRRYQKAGPGAVSPGRVP